jgi:hypothetical protein
MNLKELNNKLDTQLEKVMNLDLASSTQLERIKIQSDMVVNIAKQKLKIVDLTLQEAKARKDKADTTKVVEYLG